MAAKIAAIQSLDLDESAEKRRQTFLKFFYESEQRKHEPAVPKSKLALLDPDSEDEDRLMIDFDEEAAEEDNGSPKKVGHYQGEEAEEVGDHQEDMDLSLFDLDNDDVGVDAWKEMLGIDGDSEEEDREDKDARGQEESVSLQPVESSGEEVAKAEVETAKEECNISGTASDSDESEDGLRIEEEKEEPKKSIETDSENGAEEEIEETPRDANGGMGQTKENVLAKVDETQSDIKVEGPGYGVKENLSEREKSHDKYNGVEKTGLREAESVPENEEKAGGSISGEKNSIEPSVTSEGKNIGQKLEADSKNPKDEGTEEAQQETGDEEEVEDGEILTSSDDEDDAPGSREPADQNCSEPPPLNKKNFPSQNHPNHPFEVSSRGVPQFPPPLPFHPAHRSPSIPPGMGQNPDNCWGHQGPVHSNGHNQAHPMFDQPPPVQFHGPPPPIRPHFPSGGINQYSRSMNPMQRYMTYIKTRLYFPGGLIVFYRVFFPFV